MSHSSADIFVASVRGWDKQADAYTKDMNAAILNSAERNKSLNVLQQVGCF